MVFDLGIRICNLKASLFRLHSIHKTICPSYIMALRWLAQAEKAIELAKSVIELVRTKIEGQ
jgi:hypothetical protein